MRQIKIIHNVWIIDEFIPYGQNWGKEHKGISHIHTYVYLCFIRFFIKLDKFPYNKNLIKMI